MKQLYIFLLFYFLANSPLLHAGQGCRPIGGKVAKYFREEAAKEAKKKAKKEERKKKKAQKGN